MGPGTALRLTPTTPVGPPAGQPVCPHSRSAAKMSPLPFLVSNCASVALVTVKCRSLMFGVDPPLQLLEDVHEIPPVKVPAGPVLIEVLVTPVRPPVMVTVDPFSV